MFVTNFAWERTAFARLVYEEIKDVTREVHINLRHRQVLNSGNKLSEYQRAGGETSLSWRIKIVV